MSFLAKAEIITRSASLGHVGSHNSAEALSQLYFARWRIEVNFAHLKTTMGMDVLKCQTVDGVLKELIVFALVYNLIRLVMWTAALRQGVEVERISFIDAARWLAAAHPAEQLIPLVVKGIKRCQDRVGTRK